MADDNTDAQKKEDIKDNAQEDVKNEDIAEEMSPIEEAKKINAENRKLLDEMKIERKQIEKATAEMLVGGQIPSLKQKAKETEDEIWAHEAKIRYAGTGMDPT